MQNKGAIRLFAILLALASLYSLSFTFFSKGVESDADKFANGDPQKKAQYLDSMNSVEVYNFAWLRKFTYSECKEKSINFGLDLKGGMNVTLEVSVVDLIKGLSVSKEDTVIVRSIERARKLEENSQDDFVTLFGRAFKELYPNQRLATYFASLTNKDVISYQSSDEEVMKYLQREAKSAIDNSFNVLRTRIDRFGVTQPNIQSLGGGRILVELPGVKDPQRVRKLLQGSAQLEFWETYDAGEIWPAMEKANEKIRDLRAAQKGTDAVAVDSAKADSTTAIAATDSAKKDTANNSLLSKIEKGDSTRKDSSKVASKDKKDFAKEYPLYSVLTPYTTQDGHIVPGPVVGICHIKDTAKVNRMLVQDQVRRLFPNNLRFYWTVKAMDKAGNFHQLVAIKAPRDGKAPLNGDVITNAYPEAGQNQGRMGVSMSMNSEGADIWARLTKENIKRSVAVVLDGYVYSFPTVQNEITGGHSQITGDFTIAEATDLANVLKSGKLPAPARIIEEAVVGPSLGAEAISAGMMSFIIALLIVILYMWFYYNKSGMVANVAMLVNLFFIFGVLASLGAVLTLPGIAGIVLTMGMALDANIIIYERVREELAAGKNTKLAIADGFKHSYAAIIDANVTTFMTGVILFFFGSGPIQGFATTLIIGILTTLFCAIFITRLVFELMLNKKWDISFGNKLTQNALRGINIDWIGNRKVYYAISSTIIVAGIASIIIRGYDVGVGFKGGRTFVVRFDKTIPVGDVQKTLETQFQTLPDVKVYGESNQVKITTSFMIDDKSTSADSVVEHKLYEGLAPFIGGVDFPTFDSKYKLSSQKVGPTIADDLIWSAILAIILSLIGISIYITLRFRNWQFGLGALASLFHDVMFLMGAYSLLWGFMPFSMQIDQDFIAAILTVVGYSINDTVIIFDRVREYRKEYPKRDRKWIINSALNSTLSRTINTVATVLITLIIMFIFGGEVIRGFVFAMMIGITIGTYSSLCVASPILFDTTKKLDEGKEPEQAKSKK